jgi:hypothetical protein
MLSMCLGVFLSIQYAVLAAAGAVAACMVAIALLHLEISVLQSYACKQRTAVRQQKYCACAACLCCVHTVELPNKREHTCCLLLQQATALTPALLADLSARCFRTAPTRFTSIGSRFHKKRASSLQQQDAKQKLSLDTDSMRCCMPNYASPDHCVHARHSFRSGSGSTHSCWLYISPSKCSA